MENKYYRLTDKLNNGMLIMEDSEGYYTFDALHGWVEDDIFEDYLNPYSKVADKYIAIPSMDIEESIDEYIRMLDDQIAKAEGFNAINKSVRKRKIGEEMKYATEDKVYQPVAILIPTLISELNDINCKFDYTYAKKWGFNHKVATMVDKITEGYLKKDFNAVLDGDISLLNLLIAYAKKIRNKGLLNSLQNTELYKAFYNNNVDDIAYIMEQEKELKNFFDE